MSSFQPAYIRAFEEGLLRQKAEKARRGLLIRHLVLPGGLAGTRQIMRFIARSISTGSCVNVMSQYRPCGRAGEVDGLGGSLSPAEYHLAVRIAKQEGVTRLDDPRAFVLA
jgi:putative pyruvate formate lyase activating enzyme